MFDLLIHGGTVLDPAAGVHERADVGIRRGRVAAVAPGLADAEAAERIDASGLLVTPGLVDLHTHVLHRATPLGMDPDEVAWRTGVTTWVDAGSAGATAFPALAEWVARPARVRVLAFVNLSHIGLVSPGDEFKQLGFADVERCVAAARAFPDLAVGVKARIDRDTVGVHGVEPIRRARVAADELGLPLMIHISHGPPEVTDVLAALGPGDLLTHAFTGLSMRVVDADGAPLPELVAAIERGVRLDLGHGMGSFSFEVAERLRAAGIWPDAISSDAYLHASRSAMVDLPTCMGKLLALGMGLEDVVAAATERPAALIGRPDLGTLRPGVEADVALFELERGSFDFYDCFHERRSGTLRLSNRLTLRAGRPLGATVAAGLRGVAPSEAWRAVDADVERVLRAAAAPADALLPTGFGPPEPRR